MSWYYPPFEKPQNSNDFPLCTHYSLLIIPPTHKKKGCPFQDSLFYKDDDQLLVAGVLYQCATGGIHFPLWDGEYHFVGIVGKSIGT